MGLPDIAQIIIRHASTGPADTPGQKVRNTLSPALEKLIIEIFRGHLIRETITIKNKIEAELDSLKALIPQELHAQFDLSVARVREIIHSLIK